MRLFIVILLISFLSINTFAQYAKLRGAFVLSEEPKTLDSAKKLINIVCAYPETREDPQSWYLKGLINKQLACRENSYSLILNYSNETWDAFNQSISLDKTAENKLRIADVLNGLFVKLNTTLESAKDTTQFKLWCQMVEFQKSIAITIKPGRKADSIAVHYYLQLGIKAASEEALNKVLMLQPNQLMANYYMGLLHYKKAKQEGTINKESAQSIYRTALYYMEKAYQANPQKRDVLNGLSEIYYGLNDNEHGLQFHQLAIDVGVN